MIPNSECFLHILPYMALLLSNYRLLKNRNNMAISIATNLTECNLAKISVLLRRQIKDNFKYNL